MEAFDKHRTRRIICNDDGDQQFGNYPGYDYDVHDEASFISARTGVTFGTQVDTYVWCVGNGTDPPYANTCFQPGIESADHASDMIIRACHGNGVEVWASLQYKGRE